MQVQDNQWEEHYKHERTEKQIKKQKKQQMKTEKLKQTPYACGAKA